MQASMENSFTPFAEEDDSAVYPVLLNADITIILGQASNAAYDDFANKPIAKTLSSGQYSFNLVDRFTGFDDAVWGSGSVEKFGLVYQSQTDAGTYLFAFRGTASFLDALLDVESGFPAEFKAFDFPSGFPYRVHVGDGFYSIYSSKTTGMPGSMQAQLFAMLDKFKPNHTFITGHSLGCPLASMFALDIAVSRPGIRTSNINFASPRVGTASWKNAYDSYVTKKLPIGGARNETIRIANNFDEVPKLPPEGFPTHFRHVGQEFPVSYTVQEWHIDRIAVVDSWHSLSNYRYVVDRAVVSTPQGWSGVFPDAPYPSWKMVSHNPFTTKKSSVREWVEASRASNEEGQAAVGSAVSPDAWTARGRVVGETGKGRGGLVVSLYDKDLIFDDVLGTTVTDHEGNFRITYRTEAFGDLFEQKPDLYLKATDGTGKTLYTSEQSVRSQAGREEVFNITLS